MAGPAWIGEIDHAHAGAGTVVAVPAGQVGEALVRPDVAVMAAARVEVRQYAQAGDGRAGCEDEIQRRRDRRAHGGSPAQGMNRAGEGGRRREEERRGNREHERADEPHQPPVGGPTIE
jgi:hypothetical protein